MCNIKDQCRLLLSAFSIVFISYLLQLYLQNGLVNETSAAIVVKFVDEMDQIWVQQFRKYYTEMLENFDKSHVKWNDSKKFTGTLTNSNLSLIHFSGPFTPNIALCKFIY